MSAGGAPRPNGGELDPERRDWDELAAVDPFWAVLTCPGGPGHSPAADDFLRTGDRIAKQLLRDASRFGVPDRLGQALDFGCGPGRITRALAGSFDESLGVDVSPVMVAEARRLNRGVSGCRFELMADPALRELDDGTFDLVYTKHVLEHASRRLILEAHVPALVRVLAPGGLLVIGLPAQLRLRHRLGARRAAYHCLRRLGLRSAFLQRRLRLHPMRMTAVCQVDVEAALQNAGAQLLDVRTGVGTTGALKATYFATKHAESERRDAATSPKRQIHP